MNGKVHRKRSLNRLLKSVFITVLTTVVTGACSSDGQEIPLNDASVVSHSFVDGIERLVFTLSPEQQVPPLLLEGATAEANLTFDENSNVLSGSVSASGLTGDATAAHIQRGFAGSRGSIVLTLEASSTVANVFNIPDNTELSADEQTEFLRGEYYINVQTEANKEGEVRGQLIPSGVRSYRVTLSGEQAVPPIDTEATGLGVITYQTSTELIWGSITVSGIEASSANLHLARIGETGPTIVSFTVDPNEQNVWRADAVPAGDILLQFLSGKIYFSVTADSDPREIRGQIPGARPVGPLELLN